MNKEELEFKRLYDEYWLFMFKIAHVYCTHEDAEEVVSDVFMKIWKRWEVVKNIDNIDNYIFIAIRNQSFRHIRKYKKIEEVSLCFCNLKSDSFDVKELKELEKVVDEAIDELPKRCRQAFYLVREEGLTYRKAAEYLSISQNTLNSHLKKANKRVREVISEYNSQ